MIGLVDPKQLQATIDGFNQARFAGESIYETDAPVRRGQRALGQLVMDVRSAHHWAITFGKVAPVQSLLKAPPACSNPIENTVAAHSKILRASLGNLCLHTLIRRKTLDVFEFFSSTWKIRGGDMLA